MVPAFRRPYPAYRVNAYRVNTTTPMADMNMTPLIDVLLVLLVMLILAIPLSTNKVEVALPSDRGPPPVATPQVALTISAAGQTYWNGEAVTRSQLAARLSAAAAQPNEPVIRFQPDPRASYDASVQVIALAADAGLEKFAFVGNEQHRSFGK